MNNKNIEQAVSAAKEMKPPKHFLSEMLNKMVVYSLDRSDEDREHTSTLIHTLCTEGMVTGEHLLQVCSASANLGCKFYCIDEVNSQVPMLILTSNYRNMWS